MASPWTYGGSGDSSGHSSSMPWTYHTPKQPTATTSHHHSLFGKIVHAPMGLLQNFATDVKNFAFGLPSGLVMTAEHPIRSAEDIGKMAWHDWSPWFKGGFHAWTGAYAAAIGQEGFAKKQFQMAGHDFAKFGKQTYEHPLAPLLDIATVFSAGAGAVGKISKVTTSAAFAKAMAKEEAAAVTRGLEKIKAPSGTVIPVKGTPEWDHLVKQGGGINTARVEAGLTNWQKFGRPQSVALHGRGADAGITLYKKLPSNPWARANIQAKRAIGHRMARAMPNWWGETSPIRDLSAEGEFNRLAAKNKSYHDAAHITKAAGAMQITRMLDAGHAIINDPHSAAQYLHEHARPQLEARATPYQVVADTAKKVNKKTGKITHLQAPHGWSFLKKDPEQVPAALFKENTAAEFHRYSKDKFGALNTTTKMEKVDNLHRDAEGNLRMVRTSGVERYNDEFHQSGKFVEMMVKKPTNIWKRLVLAPAPRYFLNNAVGNLAMYLFTSNVHAVRALVEGWRNIHGEKVATRHMLAADKILHKHLGPGYDVIENHLGATFKQGTAGEQIRTLDDAKLARSKRKAAKGGQGELHYQTGARRALSTLGKGFLPITHEVAERSLRRSVSYGLLKAQPEVRLLMKQGKSFNQAADLMLHDPAFHTRIMESTNDVLGDYHHLSPFEQQIRNFVPFYTWLRAINRHTGHLALEHPGRAAALTYAGQLGIEKTKEVLGDLPDFLKVAMPLELLGFHHNPNSRAGIISTQGLNPYASVPQAIDVLNMLVTGRGRPNEAMAQILGPLPAGAIEFTTGQSLLSGKKIKSRGGLISSIGINQFLETPLPRLYEAAAGGTKTTNKAGQPTLYKSDFKTALAAFLGVPVKEMSTEAAYNLALRERGEKKPPKQRGKSPFDPSKRKQINAPWSYKVI